jgi:hypothetical protein
MQVLRMTHRLILVTICAKYFYPLIYEKCTGHKIYNITMTSKCDLDLRGR